MAGNIRIFEATSRFQKVSKGIIFNKEIDPFTLGIYVTVLALGKKWELNITGLASYLGITDAKIRRAFALLESAGYLRRRRVQDESGKFRGWDYEIGELPLSELSENRPSENTDIGKNRPSENQQVGNINKDYTGSKEINEHRETNNNAFDFRASLISLGVTEAVVDDWLEVRKRSRAVNSRTAFDEIAKQIEKSGLPADDCIRKAVARNWRGFEAAWMVEKTPTPQAPRPEQRHLSPEERTMAALARLQARDGMLHTFNNPDEQ